MKSYRGVRAITTAEGWQEFGCLAKSLEGAVSKINSGDCVFVCEEVEVTSSNDVTLEDIEQASYIEDENNLPNITRSKLISDLLEVVEFYGDIKNWINATPSAPSEIYTEIDDCDWCCEVGNQPSGGKKARTILQSDAVKKFKEGKK